ncbi:hypothetical protein BHE74_00034857 [Ensete ventricosum]|nr:hypothetical protein BHE74_00034857 [Ensete ventricosum]
MIILLKMEERMTLCNMVVEAGGKNGVVPADETTFKYLEDKTSKNFEPVYSDDNARFIQEYRIDVSKLEPLVAKVGKAPYRAVHTGSPADRYTDHPLPGDTAEINRRSGDEAMRKY